MHAPLDGINTALITPFDEHEEVDEIALASLVEDQINHGIHGLVINGSTGEFAALSPEERQQNVELVAEVANGRVPLIVQVGSMTTREAVSHTQHAAAHGAACAMLVGPWYEPINETEIRQHVQAVAAVGLPIMLYNNPAATGWSMTPEFIAELAQIPEVQYIKDTTGNAGRLFRIQELADGALEILNGQDTLAYLGFLAGTRGAVWGAGNSTPAACVALWRLTVDHPDLLAAKQLWSAFYPVNRFFEEEGYVAAVKAAANLRGLDAGIPRRPILPLTQDRVTVLAGLLERLDAAVSTGVGL